MSSNEGLHDLVRGRYLGRAVEGQLPVAREGLGGGRREGVDELADGRGRAARARRHVQRKLVALVAHPRLLRRDEVNQQCIGQEVRRRVEERRAARQAPSPLAPVRLLVDVRRAPLAWPLDRRGADHALELTPGGRRGQVVHHARQLPLRIAPRTVLAQAVAARPSEEEAHGGLSRGYLLVRGGLHGPQEADVALVRLRQPRQLEHRPGRPLAAREGLHQHVERVNLQALAGGVRRRVPAMQVLLAHAAAVLYQGAEVGGALPQLEERG
mmetsp:Transcript_33597/g.99597  ORF Transcript_33597/g.99597 Transcript_33597/m.99597 type:complete len:269 (-) Transcript_33597:219-1025(-)